MANFVLAPCVEEELWVIWEFIARDKSQRRNARYRSGFRIIRKTGGCDRCRVAADIPRPATEGCPFLARIGL